MFNNNMCGCGLIAKQGITSKGENQGRRYASCSKSITDKSRCKYFMWLDSEGKSSSSSRSSYHHTSKGATRTTTLSDSSKSIHSQQSLDNSLESTIQLMNLAFPSKTSSSSSNKPSNIGNSSILTATMGSNNSSSLSLSQLCSQMADLNIDEPILSSLSFAQQHDQQSSSGIILTSSPRVSNSNSFLTLSSSASVSSTLPTLLEENMEKELNSKQYEAVCAGENDCVCVYSGPGSGKTKTITYRIAYLCIVKGMEPKNIFAMTFTNKAAQEMKTRLVHLVKTYDFQKRINPKEFTHIGTFHAVCATVLRNEMHYLTSTFGLDQKFMIFDSEEQESIIKNLYKTSTNHVIRGLLPARYSIEEMAQVLSPSLVKQTISKCKNQEVTALAFSKSFHKDTQEKAISELFIEYQQYLMKHNGVDFDDLLLYVVYLFDNFPEVREKYTNQCAALLVDEFQDINKLQYKVSIHLNSKRKNIFLVGDSDQNIYTFRFSDSSIMVDIIKKYEKEGKHMKLIMMNQNYRSTNNIVKFSDKIIERNSNRVRKVDLVTSNTQGIPVSIVSSSDEANFIANEIIKLTKLNGNIQYGDFAILIRINSASRAFEDIFDRMKVPYRILNSTRFYDSMEVKDILAYAKAISNPDNDHFLLNCVNIPKRCISEETIAKLLNLSALNKKPLRSIIKNHQNELNNYLSNNELHILKSTLDFIEKSQINIHSPSTIINDIIQVIDYESYLRYTEKNMFEIRWENLKELIRVCQEFESKSTIPSIASFLQSISISTDMDPTPNDSTNVITISTIHAAKGLEFGIVFVAGVENGNIPYYRAKERNEIEEERRLLFVACTRAQSLLCLTSSKTRFKFNRNAKTEVSDFLTAVTSNYLTCYSESALSSLLSDNSNSKLRQETINHLIACREKKSIQETSNRSDILSKDTKRFQNMESFEPKSESNVPEYWFNKEKFKIVEVTNSMKTIIQDLMDNSCEKKTLGSGKDQAFFKKQYTNLEVVKVERVENPNLFGLYRAKMSQMKAFNDNFKSTPVKTFEKLPSTSKAKDWIQDVKLCNDVNEKYFWHGTDPNVVSIICEHGLDARVSSLSGLFGAGIYFAEYCSKSDQYCSPKDNLFHMFLCRVMIGNQIEYIPKGTSLNNTRRPSVIPNTNGRTFDSILGKPNMYREFVIYDSCQCYPEYLITYKRQ